MRSHLREILRVLHIPCTTTGRDWMLGKSILVNTLTDLRRSAEGDTLQNQRRPGWSSGFSFIGQLVYG